MPAFVVIEMSFANLWSTSTAAALTRRGRYFARPLDIATSSAACSNLTEGAVIAREIRGPPSPKQPSQVRGALHLTPQHPVAFLANTKESPGRHGHGTGAFYNAGFSVVGDGLRRHACSGHQQVRKS